MSKGKSKTFRSDNEVTVVVPGHSTISFPPRTLTTTDPAVIAALEANPDVSEVKSK